MDSVERAVLFMAVTRLIAEHAKGSFLTDRQVLAAHRLVTQLGDEIERDGVRQDMREYEANKAPLPDDERFSR
jgi:hypothetical protein